MSIAYQCDSKGYFLYAVEDNGFLPNGATYVKPGREKKGYIQRFNGDKWEYIENHTGEKGYIDGKPFEVSEYGPLPSGWSETPPQPSVDEMAAQLRAERDYKLSASDKYMVTDFPIDAQKLAAVKEYRQSLRDITKQATFPKSVTWPKNPFED